ncbi:hypothetical protein AWZ03_010675 [Drosophila navojoa]|uniref:glycerol-3-phosphate dehydrogenase n=1 Tax=Drosophila navojoa TaxID=7232 RepID=A0A484B2B4_DRONA|nr:uncharacterized protein LOC108649413 [Drosophila navojoa]TDG42893.1 hypothetical protein AWZ03_010675 [Drosophila navojoa]
MLMKMRMSLAASAWPKQPYRLLSSMSAMLHQGLKAGRESSGQMPKRKQQMTSLKSEHFDILVIGGGAIGCGCALEAASRGFKTALIEAEDFASGASCKSSKLIEGSNSYLHAAIQGADLQQIFMLQQLLNERATMLTIAPHLNRVQPMLMPIYSPLRLPLYWLGLKMYDAMAGMSNVRGSHFLSKQATLNEFPLLRKDGLLGSLIYYDVQLDDARMCLALAMTAVKLGATVANYVRLLKLMPSCYQDCREVLVADALQEESFIINTRVIINATGAGTDAIRKLEDCRANPIAVPHLGTHIALPGYYGSQNCGLLFPSCDGCDEALIMLPFENRLLVGSMDVERPEPTGEPPAPTADVVNCLLRHTRRVLDDCVQLREEHVLSAWTGVKPSIMCPTNADTATDRHNIGQDKGKGQGQDQQQDKEPQVVPNFLLEVSGNQMITLAGGRWSTYRVMAVDAINTAIESCLLEPHSDVSVSSNLLLDGAENFCCMLPLDLVQAYDLPMDVAQHLAESYGSNAPLLLCPSYCPQPDSRQRLHPQFPYIQAEVIYACQREYACHVVDVIARRLRVAFVDAAAAQEMLPTVLEIMSEELGWDQQRQLKEMRMARKFLRQEMGLGDIITPKKNRPESEQCQQALAGDSLAFSPAMDPGFPAISHADMNSQPSCTDTLSRTVQAGLAMHTKVPMMSSASATRIGSGSALANESSPVHRASMVRGTSSVGHSVRGSSGSSRDSKRSTVRRRVSDKTPDRPTGPPGPDRPDGPDGPDGPDRPVRLKTCSFSPYVIPDSGPEGEAPQKLDVSAKAKNASEMRTDPHRKLSSPVRRPSKKSSSREERKDPQAEQAELPFSNASNKGNRAAGSGKALEGGVSRAGKKTKSRRTSASEKPKASDSPDMAAETSKRSSSKRKTQPTRIEKSRPKHFTAEDVDKMYGFLMRNRTSEKAPADKNPPSGDEPTSALANSSYDGTSSSTAGSDQYSSKMRTEVERSPVEHPQSGNSNSSLPERVNSDASMGETTPTHPKCGQSPGTSKPTMPGNSSSSPSSSGSPRKNNNTRYASTVSAAESSTAATAPSSDSEVTLIMPSRSVSRLNAPNDQISERLIVGNALEVGSRIHDTVTILRHATASLKKIKENMRKSKSINQVSTDATSASNASSIGIAQDVSEPPELKQPKQADDDKRRSGIANTRQNDNDLGTNK